MEAAEDVPDEQEDSTWLLFAVMKHSLPWDMPRRDRARCLQTSKSMTLRLSH